MALGVGVAAGAREALAVSWGSGLLSRSGLHWLLTCPFLVSILSLNQYYYEHVSRISYAQGEDRPLRGATCDTTQAVYADAASTAPLGKRNDVGNRASSSSPTPTIVSASSLDLSCPPMALQLFL